MNTEIITDHVLFDETYITNDDISIKISGEIDADCADNVCCKLIELDKKNLQFIPIIIHSEGGGVNELLQIINCIDSCITPIMTITQSCACSAAACIFALGSANMRIMAPNSYLMFHESSMGAEGKQTDIAALNNNFVKIDRMINKKIEKHIDLDANFFDNHPQDFYISAKEAHRFGIATHVGYPVIKLKIMLDMSFDVKCNKRHEIEDNNKRTKYLRTKSGTCTDIWNNV